MRKKSLDALDIIFIVMIVVVIVLWLSKPKEKKPVDIEPAVEFDGTTHIVLPLPDSTLVHLKAINDSQFIDVTTMDTFTIIRHK